MNRALARIKPREYTLDHTWKDRFCDDWPGAPEPTFRNLLREWWQDALPWRQSPKPCHLTIRVHVALTHEHSGVEEGR